MLFPGCSGRTAGKHLYKDQSDSRPAFKLWLSERVCHEKSRMMSAIARRLDVAQGSFAAIAEKCRRRTTPALKCGNQLQNCAVSALFNLELYFAAVLNNIDEWACAAHWIASGMGLAWRKEGLVVIDIKCQWQDGLGVLKSD